MPYSTTDQSNLPGHIKKLGAKQRRQWIHVWNSVHESTGDESKAFAAANASLKKKKEMAETKSVNVRIFQGASDSDLPIEIKSLPSNVRRSWVSSYNYYVTSYGDEEAALTYANENTYVPLCDMMGDGSGTGMKAYKPASDGADPEEDDDEDDTTPVPKVGDKKPAAKKKELGLVAFFKSVVKSIAGDGELIGDIPDIASPITFFKDTDGRLRAFIVYSNNFKDKHKEILPEAAHKEYAEWVEKTDMYPEFQLWHCGSGTRWGKADFVDYVDGFAVASGLVDEGKEYIAEALQKQKDTRVSHGFYGLKSKDGTYLIYRSFELSALPADAAANYWTAASIGSKEFAVPFSSAKKAYLKTTGMTDEQIVAAEGNLKALSDTLKEAGIEYKEADAGAGDNGGNAILLGEIRSLTGAVQQLAGVVVAKSKELDEAKVKLEAVITESAKGVETRVEEALTARVAGAVNAGGYRASESTDNVLTKEAGDKAKAAVGDDGSQWFAKMLDGQFSSLGIGAQTGGPS